MLKAMFLLCPLGEPAPLRVFSPNSENLVVGCEI